MATGPRSQLIGPPPLALTIKNMPQTISDDRKGLNQVNWRNIPVTLINAQKREEEAQACAKPVDISCLKWALLMIFSLSIGSTSGRHVFSPRSAWFTFNDVSELLNYLFGAEEFGRFLLQHSAALYRSARCS